MKKRSQNISTSKSTGSKQAGLGAAALAYFDARAESLQKHLKMAVKHYSIEAIHEMRVDVKRIRAANELIMHLDKRSDLKTRAKRIRKIYRAAGVLRDIDVQQEKLEPFLQKYEIGEYYNFLKQQELREREQFVPEGKAFKAEVLTSLRRVLKSTSLPDELDKQAASVQQLITSNLAEIARIGKREKFPVVTLHDLRKLSKKTRYMLEIHTAAFGATPRWTRTANRLKVLHQSLGHWRDAHLTLVNMQKFLKSDAERPLLREAAYREVAAALKLDAAEHLKSFRSGWKLLSRESASPTKREVRRTRSYDIIGSREKKTRG
jgi:CHAD domain-containing protein